ncbi:MAG: PhoX family protein [Cytophagaceae bacterium]|nr:PhoX family protein [Cytophagaceae bacterium]MDW8455332.1 DUF839 domain-containing protein [Cytophagaceae bacterium]
MKEVFLIALCLYGSNRLYAQLPFKPLDEEFNVSRVIIPEGLKYDVLFREEDTVFSIQGKPAPAKGMHDYNVYMPFKASSKYGQLFVGHESVTSSDILGDGGGGTIMSIVKNKNGWRTYGSKIAIDFSAIGGTYNNCSGYYASSKGTILSAEEFPPASNAEMFKKGFRDTSDYNGRPRYHNFGWMVEINPKEYKATSKLYAMGRYSHEAAYVMPDNKTVYLTDDFLPSVFFKFVCEKENQFDKGQLYAYKQLPDSHKGVWIKLPMEMDSLVIIRDVALRMGASIFVRMEWMTGVDGKIYITETGADDFSLKKEIEKGGIPANHLSAYKKNSDYEYDYPYGSVLVFDPATDEMKVYLAGGAGKRNKHFSNPDGICHTQWKGKKYLVINEDLVGVTKGRVNKEGEQKNIYTNEIWWLDLSVQNPTIDDLQRFLIAPAGAETTGGYFTPDGKTYFVNIQHPDDNNSYPFDKSLTLAITGFK